MKRIIFIIGLASLLYLGWALHFMALTPPKMPWTKDKIEAMVNPQAKITSQPYRQMTEMEMCGWLTLAVVSTLGVYVSIYAVGGFHVSEHRVVRVSDPLLPKNPYRGEYRTRLYTGWKRGYASCPTEESAFGYLAREYPLNANVKVSDF